MNIIHFQLNFSNTNYIKMYDVFIYIIILSKYFHNNNNSHPSGYKDMETYLIASSLYFKVTQ